MNTLSQAVEQACKEPTLVKALTWIAIWEAENIVKSARLNLIVGPDGRKWDSCFETLFNMVIDKWFESDLGA